jgi:hypothetical protein
VSTLDKILSGDGEAMPSTDEKLPATETTQEQQTTEKTEQAAPQQAVDDQGDDGEVVEHAGQKMVPLPALHAERAKGKRYTEQIAAFEQRMKESDERAERRLNALLERLAPQRQQPEAQKPPDWWENPDEAYRLRRESEEQQRIQREMANHRYNAETRHTAEKVDAAERAFMVACESGQMDPADYQKVVNNINRYDAAVQWHKDHQRKARLSNPKVQALLDEIGDDPDAWVAKRLTQHQQQNGQGESSQAAPVMPSNLAGARNVGTRSGPAWAGPTPLTSIFKQ